MSLLTAISSVFPIAFMIGVGFFVARRGWINESVNMFIAKIVINVAMPAFMIYSFTTGYTREQLLGFRFIILIPLVTELIVYLISMLLARISKVPINRRGLFCAMFTMGNIGFMGIPVTFALFGNQVAPITVLYFISTSVTFWTFGANGIRRDKEGEMYGGFDIKSLKNLLNGGIIGVAIGILLVIFGVSFPPVVNDTFRFLGSLVTPLPMLFIGGIIAKFDWKKLKFTKDFLFVILGRFMISPIILIAVIMSARNFFYVDALTANVFIIQASMPIMSQIPLVAKNYGADHEYATALVAMTTLLSLIVVPIFSILLGA